MSKIEFDFYTSLLRENCLPASRVPRVVLRSKVFKSMLESGIVIKKRRGAGFVYLIEMRESFESFYSNAFPHPDINVQSQTDSQMKYRNTKAASVEKERIIFLRGNGSVVINGERVDLAMHTKRFGLFSAVLKSLQANKICFVENVEPFLNAEKLLGEGYVFIHFYGRLPKEQILKKITCKEYLHFGDYDYVGLSEFIRASIVYPRASLYMPDNFEALFDKYATQRKKHDTAYKNVLESENKDVVAVRKKLDSGLFLEQQILFGETA